MLLGLMRAILQCNSGAGLLTKLVDVLCRFLYNLADLWTSIRGRRYCLLPRLLLSLLCLFLSALARSIHPLILIIDKDDIIRWLLRVLTPHLKCHVLIVLGIVVSGAVVEIEIGLVALSWEFATAELPQIDLPLATTR